MSHEKTHNPDASQLMAGYRLFFNQLYSEQVLIVRPDLQKYKKAPMKYLAENNIDSFDRLDEEIQRIIDKKSTLPAMTRQWCIEAYRFIVAKVNRQHHQRLLADQEESISQSIS